jgi:tetratricopeptide (TPR) repeat protein
LYDILKLKGKEGEKVVDHETATSVAMHANARQVLLGSILQVEPNLVITSQLVDVGTGTVTASQKITGEPGERIFSLVDELTREIKNDLALPAAAAEEVDLSISDITTSSQDAYRHYLEGVDNYNKFYYTEAIASFEKALEYDSTFAMAYYWISRSGPARADKQQRAIAKAVQYSDRTSKKEIMLINARSARMSGDPDGAITELEELLQEFPDEKQAFEMLARIYRNNSDFKKAIANWHKVIVLDPLDARTYNMLAYDYHYNGDDDSAIVMINKYIDMAPDDANPYDTRGDLYTYSGRLDKAIDSYKKAIKLKPGFFSEEKLGDLYAHEGKYDEARKRYLELLKSEDLSVRGRGRLKLAFIPLIKGKLNEALEVLNQGIGADRLDGYEGLFHKAKRFHKWLIYAEKEEWTRSITEAEKIFELGEKSEVKDPFAWRAPYIRLLVQKGDYSAAEESLAVLNSHVDDTKSNDLDRARFAQSQLELERGSPETACMILEKINPDGYYHNFLSYELGRAYLSAGRLSQAVDMFETYTDTYIYGKLAMPLYVVKAHYLLGIAYEKSGWNDKAIEQYEKFLEMWKDADTDLPELVNAKMRLVELGKGSAH